MNRFLSMLLTNMDNDNNNDDHGRFYAGYFKAAKSKLKLFKCVSKTRLRLFVYTYTIESGRACLRQRRFSKTLSRVEVFENGGSETCVDARKRRFWVAIKKHHQHGKISGIRWCSVNSQKRCKNSSVDENVLSVCKKQKTEVFEDVLV